MLWAEQGGAGAGGILAQGCPGEGSDFLEVEPSISLLGSII